MEFHVADSGSPISVNPDAVSHIGKAAKGDGAFIHLSDGLSIEVRESYEVVQSALGWDAPRKLRK